MDYRDKEDKDPALTLSSKEYFSESLDVAFRYFRFDPHPLSRTYLVDLLERYMFSQNLFSIDEETGKYKRETLAELYLKAQNEASLPARADMLKRLGDTSLYISGFFGDSLNRKLVDIDYYIEMGGAAYNSLAQYSSGNSLSEVYSCFSIKFIDFVDVLTYMSQKTRLQSDKDLLRLCDRYLATGSKLAEDQLLEQGLLNSELLKTKSIKQ